MRSARSRRAPSSPCGCSDNPGLCPAPFFRGLAVCLPNKFGGLVLELAVGLSNGGWLISFVIYKVTAVGLYRLYWFLQCGIPRHTCRFYCCLAAHQRTRKKDSAEPSFPILWTPPHPPGVIRCGGAYLLPRFIPIQVAVFRCYRYSPVPNFVQLSVFGLVSLAFQSGCWASIFRFSLLVGRAFVPAATWGFAMVFCWITADREIVPISLDANPFHQLCRVEEYSKTAFVRLKLQGNWYSMQATPL